MKGAFQLECAGRLCRGNECDPVVFKGQELAFLPVGCFFSDYGCLVFSEE